VKKALQRFAWLSELSDRGATGVEYAPVLSLVLVGSSASLEMIDERVETHYSETAQDIGRSDASDFALTTTGGASPGQR
jgi:Flp pilus assembly pilin Flp